MAGFEESGTGGSGGRKKLLIIIAAAVILLVGAGGAAYVFLLGGGPADGEHAEEVEVEDLPPPVFYDMPEIVIRLDGGQGPYLKLATVLDLASEHSVEEIKAVEPRLLDAMQTYLIELKPDEIKGTAGMYRMRQELLRRINDALPGSTRDVLFKTLILQ
jgi:flagellar FliL protein